MTEKEKKAIEGLKDYVARIKKNHFEQTQGFKWVDIILNLLENQQKELNNLKEIEKSHKEENGKLRVELEQEKEKNKELEEKCKEVVCVPEGTCFVAVPKNMISKDKIREKIEQTKKVYEEEMKPYQTEYGLDVTYLSKKEKDELINKRNCLLTQIKTYEMLLEEK